MPGSISILNQASALQNYDKYRTALKTVVYIQPKPCMDDVQKKYSDQ